MTSHAPDNDSIDPDERAKALILEESEERTEHPEETGAESSQTIPEIPPPDPSSVEDVTAL